jgi:hypothetical protein
MAQSKIVKSRRGNDLCVVTLGPKEVAKMVAVLGAWDDDEILSEVCDSLVGTQANMRKQYDAVVKTEVTLIG